MPTQRLLAETIRLKLKDQGIPDLAKYSLELAGWIKDEAVNQMNARARRERWSRLPPMDRVREMNAALQQAEEALLAEALESPPDLTSPPSED